MIKNKIKYQLVVDQMRRGYKRTTENIVTERITEYKGIERLGLHCPV